MPTPRASAPSSAPNEVTVMVFKDNNASRTFQVPLGWITRFGFLLGILGAAALLGSFFSVKFYRVARRTDPARVIDLEQQLADLRAANRGLEAKVTGGAPAAVPVPVVAATGTVNPLPVPTVTVTVTPVAAAAPGTPAPARPMVASTGPSVLFSALPGKTRDLSADAAKLPITVSTPHSSWSAAGRSFKVVFNLQYTGTDKGSQQGRIIVLARGGDFLGTYPEAVFTRPGSEALISPDKGEYFSVSRFREVKAEFKDLRVSPKSIQDIELLIMSLEGDLIFYQKLPVNTAVAAPKPATPPAPAVPATPAATTPAAAVPTPAASGPVRATPPATPAPAAKPAAPAASGSGAGDIIEPGVDQ